MGINKEAHAFCGFQPDPRIGDLLTAPQTQVWESGVLLKLLCWFDNWMGLMLNRMLDVGRRYWAGVIKTMNLDSCIWQWNDEDIVCTVIIWKIKICD